MIATFEKEKYKKVLNLLSKLRSLILAKPTDQKAHASKMVYMHILTFLVLEKAFG